MIIERRQRALPLSKGLIDMFIILVCPGACSGSGQCVNGVCICNSNYDGSDCSIHLTTSPKINQIVG